ncbi:MAG: hypothetical protein R3A78_00640 [Polyangiales bacterium]
MSNRSCLLGALIALCVPATVAHSEEPDPSTYRSGGDPSVPHPIMGPGTDIVPGSYDTSVPTVEWQEIVHVPRLNGQFNTIEVDEKNPNRIFVGTEEATIVHSEDNGVTWQEQEMRPFVVQTRTVQVPTRPSLNGAVDEGIATVLQTPGAMSLFEYPRLGLDDPLEYQIFPDDITSEVDDLTGTANEDIRTRGLSPISDKLGSYVDTFYYSSDLVRRDTTLTRAVAGRKFETSPVRMIAFCPGNDFPILAATYDELYGSPDDGTAWVRLLAIPGNLKIHRVRWSRRDPRRVIVSTDFGLFYSNNGGASFDQEFTGLPGEPSYAAGWGNASADGTEQAFFGLDSILFRGVPGSTAGMVWVYPNFNNPDTAPWKRINSVETTPDGEIWLATIDGVRRSKDNGENWEIVEPYLFNGHNVQQVLAGGNEKGELRIAVFVEDCPEPPLHRRQICRNSFVYASDDRGETWFPYFMGMSRRRVVWMAATPYVAGEPGRWWIATGGAVWSNGSGYDAQRRGPGVDREAQAWAKDRLRRNLPLREAKEIALENKRLSPRAMDALWARARSSGLVPDLRILFNLDIRDTNVSTQQRLFEPYDIATQNRPLQWSVTMQLRWYTFALAVYLSSSSDPEDLDGEENETRGELYELRRQLDFMVEDAWHERVNLLNRLAEGMSNRYQIAVTQERIDILELTLEYWMGRALPDVRRRFWR